MLADVVKGLYIIKGRSEGLARFVQHFRSLTLLPKPVPEQMDIETFFTHVLFLFKHDITEQKIKTNIIIFPSYLTVNADPALMEQVLINLLKNSIEALKNIPDAMITLKAHQEADKRISIQVIDNGIGIQEELLDQIFVPFFSTKKDGSGIGLSISRQIIRMLGGTISIHSEPNIKTVFKITL
jgi:signal transduction histidine kinase